MRYWRLARLCADGVCGCCCSMELRLVGRTGVPPRRLLLSRIAFATTRLAILRCISCESACCLAISCATLYQRSRLYPYASSASQPELGANPVSLRPPNWPKGGPMGFLDIPGLNIAQKSGEKGWNPANGVPFCARAYICRPRPLGLAGWLCDAGEYVGRP